MNAIILFALLPATILATSLTQEQITFLANLNYNQVPKSIRDDIRKATRGSSGNWCCTNDQPVHTVQMSRIHIEHVKEEDTVKVGYTKCGFMGATRCPLYDVRYKDVIQYSMELHDVPDMKQCSHDEVKCCAGFLMFAGTDCVPIETAAKNVDALGKLAELGLIG